MLLIWGFTISWRDDKNDRAEKDESSQNRRFIDYRWCWSLLFQYEPIQLQFPRASTLILIYYGQTAKDHQEGADSGPNCSKLDWWIILILKIIIHRYRTKWDTFSRVRAKTSMLKTQSMSRRQSMQNRRKSQISLTYETELTASSVHQSQDSRRCWRQKSRNYIVSQQSQLTCCSYDAKRRTSNIHLFLINWWALIILHLGPPRTFSQLTDAKQNKKKTNSTFQYAIATLKKRDHFYWEMRLLDWAVSTDLKKIRLCQLGPECSSVLAANS